MSDWDEERRKLVGFPVPEDKIAGRAWEPHMKKRVLDRVAALWDEHPDLRLGQLIMNVYEGRESYLCNVEDYPFIEDLEKAYGR